MAFQRMKRAHLRAPLKTELLYEDEGYVLKARILNISEGGLLIENLPKVPEINLMPLMIDIIDYPDFQSIRMEKLKVAHQIGFERKIVRVRAKMVRSFQAESEVDKIFVNKIGCQFVHPKPEAGDIIRKYVKTFARNTVFLLSLFENRGGKKDDTTRIIRSISTVLGYQSDTPLPVLRQKVLHDYQSLESL